MSYKVIEGLEDIFLKIKEDKKSLAVIGNAEFKKKVGEDIDNHDVVIRFNNFKIKGYEEYVGKKITWWCTHPFIENYEHRYDPSISHRKYEEFRVDGTVIIPQYDFWGEYRKKYFKILSSGMTILLILNRLKVNTDAYGFDNFETGHYWDPEHKRSEQHQPLYEKEIQDKLIYINRINCG